MFHFYVWVTKALIKKLIRHPYHNVDTVVTRNSGCPGAHPQVQYPPQTDLQEAPVPPGRTVASTWGGASCWGRVSGFTALRSTFWMGVTLEAGSPSGPERVWGGPEANVHRCILGEWQFPWEQAYQSHTVPVNASQKGKVSNRGLTDTAALPWSRLFIKAREGDILQVISRSARLPGMITWK